MGFAVKQVRPMQANECKPAPPGNLDPSPKPATLLVTVAICTRNRAPFLQRAIESVLPQLTPESELLLVDNTSTDDTPQIIARAATHPQVRALREDQLGISAARNTASLNTGGKYVLYLGDEG